MAAAIILSMIAVAQEPRVHELPAPGDHLGVRLWVDKRYHQLFDPLFVKVTVTNQSEQSMTVGTSICSGANYTLWRDPFTYKFETMRSFGDPGPMEMDPDEEWIVNYEILQTPPLKMHDHDFWKNLPHGSATIEVQVSPGGLPPDKVLHGSASQNLEFRKRGDDEDKFLRELFGEMQRRFKDPRDESPREDRNLPYLGAFGVSKFVRYTDLVKRLMDYEEKLSPGPLRDVVHLTRLLRVMYDAPTDAAKRKAGEDVVTLLESFPEIQREILQIRVLRHMDYFESPVGSEIAQRIAKKMRKKVYYYDDYPAYLLKDHGLE